MSLQCVSPVRFRGEELRLSKRNDAEGTSAHPVSAEEAWSRFEPFLKKTGVTRISDITQLDRIGIPVYNVLRPSIDGYTAAHGKGFTPNAARLSAAGESLERWFGTKAELPVFRGTWNDVSRSYPMVPPEKLALTPHSFFHKDLEIPWVLGWDIVAQEEVPLPLELVRLSPGGDEKGLLDLSEGLLFQCSSNGLSCGVHLLEALAQGLLEVIERDSVTCATMAARAKGYPAPVFRAARLETIPFERVQKLFSTLRSAGVEPILGDNATDVGIPTWNCYLMDTRDSRSVASVTHGMGSSLDHETAMIRAITEAVQARSVFLSGVRDLVPTKEFQRSRLGNGPDTLNMFDAMVEERLDCSGLQNPEAGTFEEDVLHCVECLKARGMDRVIVYQLSQPEDSVQGVRVAVPGAEGYMFSYYTPGDRGMRAIRHQLGKGSPLFREEGFAW